MTNKKKKQVAEQSIKDAPYRRSQVSVKDRVEDLLSRMTLEEKVELMGLWNGGVEDFTDDFLNDPEK